MQLSVFVGNPLDRSHISLTLGLPGLELGLGGLAGLDLQLWLQGLG